jgi:hypothetical protein
LRRSFAILGPGLITGAADDDPSGISTYSVAGAAYGYAPLWTALVTFPLMAAVQLMCARLGMLTGRGLGGRGADSLSALGTLGSLFNSRRRERHQHRRRSRWNGRGNATRYRNSITHLDSVLCIPNHRVVVQDFLQADRQDFQVDDARPTSIGGTRWR